MERLDAVLPLTASDAPRARILLRSLASFFEPLRRLYVVAPDAEVDAVRTQLAPFDHVLLRDSEVIPEIGWFRGTARVRAKLRLVGPPIHGWYVQQLVKLAIAERIETPFYVTLDSDVICVNHTTYRDLIRDGRALVQTTPPNHPEWNDDAERVLYLPRSGRQFGVTPALLSRAAVGELAAHLEQRVDGRLRRVGGRLPRGLPRDVLTSWRSFLLRNLPWTEYALYHTFLEQTGRYGLYHVDGGRDAIYSNCVWIESEFDYWDPAVDATGAFSVVQSATRIPPERVWEKVGSLITERSDTNRLMAASSVPSSTPRSLPSTE